MPVMAWLVLGLVERRKKKKKEGGRRKRKEEWRMDRLRRRRGARTGVCQEKSELGQKASRCYKLGSDSDYFVLFDSVKKRESQYKKNRVGSTPVTKNLPLCGRIGWKGCIHKAEATCLLTEVLTESK